MKSINVSSCGREGDNSNLIEMSEKRNSYPYEGKEVIFMRHGRVGRFPEGFKSKIYEVLHGSKVGFSLRSETLDQANFICKKGIRIS